jgi:hypothetical protein
MILELLRPDLPTKFHKLVFFDGVLYHKAGVIDPHGNEVAINEDPIDIPLTEYVGKLKEIGYVETEKIHRTTFVP